jgi:hypothetical protein
MKFKFELDEHGIKHTVEGDLGDWTTYVEVAQNFANLLSGAYGYTIYLDPHTENGKPLTEEELWDKLAEQEAEPVKSKKRKAK